MVHRVTGPFEYHDVTGESIESSADEPRKHAGTLRDVADDLDLDRQKAQAATEGDISGLVQRNPSTAAGTARGLSMKGEFAAGCILEWAAAVKAFDSTTARLNSEVHQAVAAARTKAAADEATPAGTPVARGLLDGLSETGHDVGDVLAAYHAAYERLKPQYRRAKRSLEDDEDRVAGRLQRGVTTKDVRHLVRAGYIPLISAGVFPHLNLTPSDRYVAMVAGLMRNHLPPEATTWSTSKLDSYLTHHHDAAQKVDDASRNLNFLAPALAGLSIDGLLKAARGASDSDRRRLAMMLPSKIGNNKDAPFDMRAQANRVRISSQIHRDAVRVWDWKRTRIAEVGGNVPDDISRLEKRARLYEGLLHGRPVEDGDGKAPEHRQIILFDPKGDGRIAEVSGVIDRHTKHVGVFIPGTTHGLDDWKDSVKHSEGFVRGSSGLAMVTWIGGDLPDSVGRDAPSRGYALDLAPRLVDFSDQLRGEMNRVGTNHADTRYMAHSYSTAVVGLAETVGLDADKVLSVEGAGMGHGVNDLSDLSERNRHTQHYSMTAPDDVISAVQASGWHGADPDTFGNTIRLQTGYYDGGKEPIDGAADSHSGVFEHRSDAWNNMLAFLTGGHGTLRHSDDTIIVPKMSSYIHQHSSPSGTALKSHSLESGGPVDLR